MQLDKYHTFLILASHRFTEKHIILAREIKKQGKSFFFIRTKIDENVRAEIRKKSFSEAAVLQKIRRNCKENLIDEAGDPISSEYLSLNALISLSKGILKRKVEVLKRRMIHVVGATALIAAIPVPGLSIVDDAALVFNEVRKYKAQLGIPEEGSERFGRLSSVTQKKFLDLNIKLANAIQLASEAAAEGFAGFARYIPFVGSVIAGASTYVLLRDSLKEIEEVALAVLEQNCLILLRS